MVLRSGCGPATAMIRTKRYPRIAREALRNRCSTFVLDGEAVLLGVFNGLHSRKHETRLSSTRSIAWL
jgi:hypothetical protein